MKEKGKADNAAAPAFGKFKTGEELLRAYNSLEAEFTKRSQCLKETHDECAKLAQRLQEQEDASKAQLATAQQQLAATLKKLDDEAFLAEKVLGNDRVSRKIIESYLADSLEQSVPVLNSGTGRSALTPVNKPKSLKDAKRLADILLNS